jgi:hypothetical protein
LNNNNVHVGVITRYTDEEVNRILAAAVSNGVMSGSSLREHALILRNRKKLGVKPTAKKATLIKAHRAAMSKKVDKYANTLEKHLDSYTAKLLEKHFAKTNMPTPVVDVPWVQSFARPAVADRFFAENASDTDDVKQAKTILKPIFRSMSNLAAQSKKKRMKPIVRRRA